MEENELQGQIEVVTFSVSNLKRFSKVITDNAQKQREPKPMWTFKDQMHKILEEIREYNFAVTGKQGESKEHTRERKIQEGLDLMFTVLTSFDVLEITEEEIIRETETTVRKFNERGWL